MEKEWAYYQPFLEDHGYMLRPRYRPGWIPEMLNSDKSPWSVEDCMPAFGFVLDAIRIRDNFPVVLKIVDLTLTEEAIIAFLTEEPGAEKHTLPLLEVIQMCDTPGWAFLVVPRMRQCDDQPLFTTVGEFGEFVEQVLEGLVFLHSRNIAHRDICAMNIVVDPSEMLPAGFHFLNPFCAPDGLDPIVKYTGDDSVPHFMKSRTEAGPMRYYYIDFGESVRFPSFEARALVTGEVGRHRKHIPEISDTVPYDPFMVGEMLWSDFLLEYTGLDFGTSFLEKLRQDDPSQRPDAQEALRQFRRLVSGMTKDALATRLHKYSDFKGRIIPLSLKEAH
ncbi:hypothetical protein B0H19DRAFT_937864 [Mycena capillaripes]|nr:hypothetical protein B0H19DRAFT_937864 [Mycena capillaripes]